MVEKIFHYYYYYLYTIFTLYYVFDTSENISNHDIRASIDCMI